MAKFDEKIEDRLIKNIIDGDLDSAISNSDQDNRDFESHIDLFDAEGGESNYDWQSNLFIPEYTSQELTQSSMDASQYFQTRDFVEVYLQDDSQEAILKADANKELINRTLNQRHMYHYQKYMRAKTTNNIAGRVYLRCWWEKETATRQVGIEREPVESDVDVNGIAIIDRDIQEPATTFRDRPIIEDVLVKDRFNYDMIDQRNVFTDNSFVYSFQDKPWVIIRDPHGKTKEELEEEKELNGYFNLDMLDDMTPANETKAAEEGSNWKDREVPSDTDIIKKFDIYKRYGKYWCKIVSRDNLGNPLVAEPGIDDEGNKLNGAELHEVIIAFASNEANKVLVAFHLTPFLDALGRPYRPIIRGLCYIHPTDDAGVGDAKYSVDLATGINDTVNLANDRAFLATMPTLMGLEGTVENNPDIYFEPSHVIPVQSMDELKEFKWEGDTQPALLQTSYFTDKMQQVNSMYPNKMGQMPALASTTATAVADASQSSNMRSNYKSLTFENTALVELYWMITQMTFQFAQPETGQLLMGDKVFDFDPNMDYFYKPVSQSIETEYAKDAKAQKWITVMQTAANIPHPQIAVMLNYTFGKIAENLGDEFAAFSEAFIDPKLPLNQTNQGGGGEGGVPTVGGGGPSNQSGVEQSLLEQITREGAGG